MSRHRRKPLFSVEDAREAILDSDSENEYDKMDLSSEEEYSSDVENEEYETTTFDDFFELEGTAESTNRNTPVNPASARSDTLDPDRTDPGATGDQATAEPMATDSVPGGSGNKRRRVAAAVGRTWEDNPSDKPQHFEFTGTPGISPDTGLSPNSTPLDCYLKYVSKEMFEEIAVETNRYASSVLRESPPSPSSPAKNWTRTSAGELVIFWALCMLMGVVGKPAIHLYWSTRNILATPFFGQTMTRDRFCLLLRFLHFNDNNQAKQRSDPSYDPLFKLRPFYDAVTTAFHTVFTPWRSIAIDEALIKFYGRLSFKTYNPRKPAKYGMKAYKICDPSGYTWKFRLYTGKAKDTIVGLVMSMMTGLLDKGYRLFMDNWYSSPTLFGELFKRKTHACGTVRANRVEMPKNLKPARKMTRGMSIFKRSKELLAMLWFDKRDVTMLSTIHTNSFSDTQKKHPVTGENIQKPDIVLDYNKYMGGVDLSDFLTNTYADMRKSLKWYKKLIFHLNDLAVTNAYIVYCHAVDSKVDHLKFVLDLVEQMITYGNKLAQDRPRPLRPGRRCNKENVLRLEFLESQHWPIHIPPTANKPCTTRPCVACKPKPLGKRKERGEQTSRPESRFMCRKCEVPLHILCFERYHTKANYRSG